MQLKSTHAGSRRQVRALRLSASLTCCALVFGPALVHNEVQANDSRMHPPAGTQLAFVRDDQIWRVNADGTGLAQLTATGGSLANRDPAWSRDGQRLAFARGRLVGDQGDTWDIYVMNADGSNVVQLTGGGYNVEPTWGPDDRSIAFSSFLSGSMGVSVIDADAQGGQGSRVLLDFPGWDAQPAWSPDGQTLTFTSDFFQSYDFTYDLGAVNADGSDVRSLIEGPFLTDDGLTYYFQAAWSPDGQSIGVVVCPYAWDNCYPDSVIAVVNPDGSELRVIAQAGSFAHPTWSPDGRWIAFGASDCRNCQSSVRFVQVDGGVEGLIVENGHSPAWRPEAGASINVGHSGAWFDPATSGQGLMIDVEPSGQSIFVAWFTFTDAASDDPGRQRWLTAQGSFSGTAAVLAVHETLGGEFDNARSVETNEVGTMRIDFSDCGNALLGYSLDDEQLTGAIAITRLMPGGQTRCEQLSLPE